MKLNPNHTALILIDLQKGIVNMETFPHSASSVVEASANLAAAFQAKGAMVVAVNVNFVDGKEALRPLTDQAPISGGTSRPADWSALVAEIEEKKTLSVTKRQWGAFHGTELDLQLRRRGIDTIVLGGISTSIGVDTTAREAYQLGYQQIFAADAMAALTEEEHEYTLKYIFPRIGRIRRSGEIIEALQ
ncbi:MAG: isochorismatase family protein [Cohnella sp.]|jgi:nicotinamidase-related amidase|nr:isochorismatase family protein [Cohnella sp.]